MISPDTVAQCPTFNNFKQLRVNIIKFYRYFRGACVKKLSVRRFRDDPPKPPSGLGAKSSIPLEPFAPPKTLYHFPYTTLIDYLLTLERIYLSDYAYFVHPDVKITVKAIVKDIRRMLGDDDSTG